jgi:hypothetical protein
VGRFGLFLNYSRFKHFMNENTHFRCIWGRFYNFGFDALSRVGFALCSIYRMFSEDLLWRVVWLMLLSFQPSDIAYLLHLSVPTIYRVWSVYEQFGVVRIERRFSRIPKVSEEDCMFVEQMVRNDNDRYIDEYLDMFEEERGFRISSSTMLRVFHVKIAK